ncbi:MAG: hypothetical protein EAX81_01520 [Candidatus Thorarchaeota archaeon]|nr:hypothetical protein [Candidatus Thorarchaeota archaeon]
MEEVGDKTEVSRTSSYQIADSAVVFRLAWYTVASKPGVLLTEYSEAESQIFKGKAMFSVDADSQKYDVRIWVEEAQRSVEITVWGKNGKAIHEYLETIESALNAHLEKFATISDDERAKLRRALVAKTCWDRLIFEILNKAPLNDVYIQLAHGREMMIKATQGEDLHSLTLSTSGWLSEIESLPRDESPPANIAAELAKKTIEWKKETHEVIARYL